VKVVLDTNVWISSLLLPKSIPGQIITAWQQAKFTVVISPPILTEIEKVLGYPKIKKRLSIAAEEIKQYLTFIHFFTEMIELNKNCDLSVETHVRDKNDEPILATLIESKANYLVTGDNDLLALDKHYPIITPSAFAELLG
jgi:putative PIN family toxin of toxin-antitoxin system